MPGATYWFPGEAVGVEVRVRPNTWILEDLPCAADRVAGLEDYNLGVGKLAFKTISAVDSRQAGSDHDDIARFCDILHGPHFESCW